MSLNPHTGDKMRTKETSDQYRDNYDKIFGKKDTVFCEHDFHFVCFTSGGRMEECSHCKKLRIV